MKKLLVFLLVITLVPSVTANGTLKIGDKATYTHIKMLDITGEKVSVADVAGDNGVLVLFSSNTCPFVMQWEGRYPDIKNWADRHKVGMIVLNSNYGNRDGVDSYEAMKKHARQRDYKFYYVVDENSQLANAFGGQTTPHAFLFNNKMELIYKGAIDDNYKSAKEVKQAYLKEAIESVANGREITVAETRPVGCSIKRKTD